MNSYQREIIPTGPVNYGNLSEEINLNEMNERCPMALTGQELKDFLVSTGAIGNCPACKQEQWIIPSLAGTLDDLADQGGIPLAKADGSIDFPSRGASIFFVACSNCGYMQIHSASIIEKKIRGERSENGDQH